MICNPFCCFLIICAHFGFQSIIFWSTWGHAPLTCNNYSKIKNTARVKGKKMQNYTSYYTRRLIERGGEYCEVCGKKKKSLLVSKFHSERSTRRCTMHVCDGWWHEGEGSVELQCVAQEWAAEDVHKCTRTCEQSLRHSDAIRSCTRALVSLWPTIDDVPDQPCQVPSCIQERKSSASALYAPCWRADDVQCG